jgi:hypothetical protein
MMDISDSEEILLHRGRSYSHTANVLRMPRSSMPNGQGPLTAKAPLRMSQNVLAQSKKRRI